MNSKNMLLREERPENPGNFKNLEKVDLWRLFDWTEALVMKKEDWGICEVWNSGTG